MVCGGWLGGKRDGGIRRLCVNSQAGNPELFGNYTSTTKYSLLTFLPKSLFEQYRRVANVFFTFHAGLSLTPFSPVRPWTAITPLVFVLAVSIIKEAQEDYKRYKQDKEINNRTTSVLNAATGQFEARRWCDVRVGDIVQVFRNEQLPADLLFLSSEAEEGTCYVETMNLDGETNLKIRVAPGPTKHLTADQVRSFSASIECEGPNARLYTFAGNLEIAGAPPVPLGAPAVLLRGCSLRNTPHIFGAVVYAGHDSKIMQNATEAPSKRSKLERTVDKIMIFMFVLMFVWCLVSAVYFSDWTSGGSYRGHWYLAPSAYELGYDAADRVETGVVSFLVALVLYSFIIPISLYVSIEIVKVVQAMLFMAHDRQMYCPITDTPAIARTSNLNEELGMVTSIMTDKTGTLTQNVMEFFKCSIGGVVYGAGVTEVERSNALRRGKHLESHASGAAAEWRERFFNFYDERLMGGKWGGEANKETIEMFLRLLAVCHTVVPEGPPDEHKIKYEAESPDESALVVAAKVLGFFFCKRSTTSVTVRECGPHTGGVPQDLEYEVLNILEFDSTRKRMSVIVRDPSGRLLIFCKGADTVIYERLDPAWPANAAMKTQTHTHMEEFGNAGLRTLCLSYAELDPKAYAGWQARMAGAKTSLADDRDEKLALLAEEVEQGLRLLGCTAIEDKLQEGVPQAIRQLAQAGIRIWVLTGDKMETAINIGYACSLLAEDMAQHVVSAERVPGADEAEAEGEGGREKADALRWQAVQQQLAKIEQSLDASKSNHAAIIIDGKGLSYAMSATLRAQFLRLGLACKAVLCCRVSPLQKAQVTELVRSHGDTTLAIGDGANDVSMIQKAHIGVGISGQEGMQAAMCADFAIAQFRFLVPLLLVHGRYSYRRLARMVKYFMYKNLLLGNTLFIFNALAAFSGSYIYNDTTMTLFNVIFTSIPPIVIGVFDRDLDRRLLTEFPQLYKRCAANKDFTAWPIIQWLLAATFQSGIIMVLVLVGTPGTAASVAGGQAWGMAEVGVIMFGAIVITVHLQLVIVEEQFTWIHHAAIWASIALWWLYLLLFGAFPYEWSLEMGHLFTGVSALCPSYWLFTLIVPVAACLPTFAAMALKTRLAPDDVDIIRELHVSAKRMHKSIPRGNQVAPAASPALASLRISTAAQEPESPGAEAAAAAASSSRSGVAGGVVSPGASGTSLRTGPAATTESVLHLLPGGAPGSQLHSRASHSNSGSGSGASHAAGEACTQGPGSRGASKGSPLTHGSSAVCEPLALAQGPPGGILHTLGRKLGLLAAAPPAPGPGGAPDGDAGKRSARVRQAPVLALALPDESDGVASPGADAGRAGSYSSTELTPVQTVRIVQRPSGLPNDSDNGMR